MELEKVQTKKHEILYGKRQGVSDAGNLRHKQTLNPVEFGLAGVNRKSRHAQGAGF
jgi:hypothetical protein